MKENFVATYIDGKPVTRTVRGKRIMVRGRLEYFSTRRITEDGVNMVDYETIEGRDMKLVKTGFALED